MKKILLVSSFLLVSSLSGCGCFQKKDGPGVITEVPIPVKCKIATPEKPYMPMQNAIPGENIFVKFKKALSEIEFRKGYEIKLEEAITECNK